MSRQQSSNPALSDDAARDLALIRAAIADPAAFEPLYRQHAPIIYRFCYRRLGQADSAADATSQTFIKAIAALKSFTPHPEHPGKTFRAWLFRIASNVVVDTRRTYRSHRSLDIPDDTYDLTRELIDPGRSPEVHGKPRWGPDVHPHESPMLMTVPMIILAVGSVALGGALTLLGFAKWLEPVTGHVDHPEPVLAVPVITVATLLFVALGVLWAWRVYATSSVEVPRNAPQGSMITVAARNDLWQDEVASAVFEQPGASLSKALNVIDADFVDGGVNAGTRLLAGTSDVFKRWQNGFVRSYAATMLLGLVVILGSILAVK